MYFRIFLFGSILWWSHLAVFSQSEPNHFYLGKGEVTNIHTNAVLRNSFTHLDIISPDKLTMSVEYAMTILDNEGKSLGNVVIPYTNFSHIKKADVWIYDVNGKMLEHKSMRDLYDISYTGSNFFSDLRLKVFVPQIKQTPYTVHYKYEADITDYIHLPSWHPQMSSSIFVEKATLRISNHSNSDYNTYLFNIPDSSVALEYRDKITTWEITRLPSFMLESFGPSESDQLPRMEIVTDQFQVESYKGKFDSWNSFGQWIAHLNSGRDTLSSQTENYIRKLTDTIPQPREKAKAIYKWMQKETRYVSIQLGVGGWQPFTATEVDQKKYGDCKALTNYTKSLMDVVGLESYYSLVYGSEDDSPVEPQMVYNQFNHVILCMPFDGDTTWVECTSDHMPFGFIGDFTDDRFALLVKNDSGKLVKTNSYPAEQNLAVKKITIDFLEENTIHGKLEAQYHDLKIEQKLAQIERPLAEQKENFYNQYHVNGLKLNTLDYTLLDSVHPTITESCDFTVTNVSSVVGKKIITPLNLFRQNQKRIAADKNRIQDIMIKRGYTETDTIVMNIPGHMKVAGLPPEKTIESDFGTYHSRGYTNENQFIYIRTKRLNQGLYPPERFEDFRNFLNSMMDADYQKLMLEAI